ncbi:metalloregulator ArsR/SmtB family transcription factor [Jeotgalibacillus terrae]|uniref:Metalloregulator ArsR/SmtB family transcription factor n=1 Tax=Jeotgalibacillus terrae TaxID=587735 RepID=A0ABW5ZKU7_9BACL|nr:metalloregulator ArsR/SmtB family transcription factor [Jeotgalibacillus terrae]MBM7580486.1 rhodanese-related sulfurtransferase/DNA-binding transcriptional ArsR family regulator [Jeotgalibacillus terrae]
MNSGEFKDEVYGEVARIGKMMSSPKRIEMLDLLTQSPKTVETLAKEARISTANASKHLQALLDAKLVRFQKQKNYVIYEIADEEIRSLVLSLRRTAETRYEEVDQWRDSVIGHHHSLGTLDEVLSRAASGETVLLDVRNREEYEYGHLPYAVSKPIDELRDGSTQYDHEVIVYCRGPYCTYAAEAVNLLKEQGCRAYLLDAGVNEWKWQERLKHDSR